MTVPETRLGDWLELLAARRSTPSGGAAVAVTLAASAALAAMVARFSESRLEDAAAIARRADDLRDRALDLAAADEAVVGALYPGSGAARGDGRPTGRQAAEVPLSMVQLAADLHAVFERLSRDANPRLAGDAQAGLQLLRGAAAAGAALVRIDAGTLGAEERAALLDALGAAEARLAP